MNESCFHFIAAHWPLWNEFGDLDPVPSPTLQKPLPPLICINWLPLDGSLSKEASCSMGHGGWILLSPHRWFFQFRLEVHWHSYVGGKLSRPLPGCTCSAAQETTLVSGSVKSSPLTCVKLYASSFFLFFKDKEEKSKMKIHPAQIFLYRSPTDVTVQCPAVLNNASRNACVFAYPREWDVRRGSSISRTWKPSVTTFPAICLLSTKTFP